MDYNNDADYEMAELERQGNIIGHLRKKGICLHGWIMAPDNKPVVCLYCDKQWPDKESFDEEYRELQITYM